jgi:hypothetical protein
MAFRYISERQNVAGSLICVDNEKRGSVCMQLTHAKIGLVVWGAAANRQTANRLEKCLPDLAADAGILLPGVRRAARDLGLRVRQLR